MWILSFPIANKIQLNFFGFHFCYILTGTFLEEANMRNLVWSERFKSPKMYIFKFLANWKWNSFGTKFWSTWKELFKIPCTHIKCKPSFIYFSTKCYELVSNCSLVKLRTLFTKQKISFSYPRNPVGLHLCLWLQYQDVKDKMWKNSKYLLKVLIRHNNVWVARVSKQWNCGLVKPQRNWFTNDWYVFLILTDLRNPTAHVQYHPFLHSVLTLPNLWVLFHIH